MSQSYLDEIAEQPAAIRKLGRLVTPGLAADIRAIRAAIDKGDVRHIILTGMGGSLFSAYGTWLRLSRSLPVPVSLWDTSELIQQAPTLLRPGAMVIAISQSGESVELCRMTELDAGVSIRVAITNPRDNTLARWASLALATEVGPEQTVSTKTYTAGLAALYIFERMLIDGGDTVAADIATLADATDEVLARVPARLDEMLAFLGHDLPLTFIGRGASYASAMMGALVTAEAAKAPTQALSGGQFRHGPLELVRDGFRSMLFLGGPGATLDLNLKTVADIARFGGRSLVVAPASTAAALSGSEAVLSLPAVAEGLLPVLEILPIQLLMVPMAIARGFEPAKFLNGSKITVIE
ncbi:SIS domain-containing protein [Shinella zoogloeoides]|uniref:SIS domain-containing protein n=1 Tax=Shinella zoogloeoides TaxID=352475 RepID=UPI00299CFED0|nr:SIS domain-containing protein [Shinella zoogloeoides]WPE23024.1 Glutamine--fructose-6-phosphate aminotransferase [isomerizing] [Shinella zoogloeoides]